MSLLLCFLLSHRVLIPFHHISEGAYPSNRVFSHPRGPRAPGDPPGLPRPPSPRGTGAQHPIFLDVTSASHRGLCRCLRSVSGAQALVNRGWGVPSSHVPGTSSG